MSDATRKDSKFKLHFNTHTHTHARTHNTYNQLCGRLLSHTLPPDIMVGSQSHVGEDNILFEHLHRIGIGVLGGTRSHTKETSLWIHSPQSAIISNSYPCDIIANCLHLLNIGRYALERCKTKPPPPSKKKLKKRIALVWVV